MIYLFYYNFALQVHMDIFFSPSPDSERKSKVQPYLEPSNVDVNPMILQIQKYEFSSVCHAQRSTQAILWRIKEDLKRSRVWFGGDNLQ